MKNGLAQRIIDAAFQHGEESGNDNEIGDLQQAVMIAFEEMPPEARKRTYDRCQELIDIDYWLSYSEESSQEES